MVLRERRDAVRGTLVHGELPPPGRRVLLSDDALNSSSGGGGFRCVHDFLPARSRYTTGAQRYGGGIGGGGIGGGGAAPPLRGLSPGSSSSTSALAGAAPMRIAPIFVGVNGSGASMTPALAAFVRTRLVPDAVARWRAALATLRVQGPLFASRTCTGYWTTSSGPYVCAEYASRSTCDSGVSDDVAIAFDAYGVLGADVVYRQDGSSSTLPAGAGLANADLGLFVTAKQTAFCGPAGSGVLAYATPCQRDQYDRPTWARINLCPASLDAANADAYSEQLSTMAHELAHAMGFTSASWPLFRDTDAARSPLTPRDRAYPDQPAQEYLVSGTCSAGAFETFIAAPATAAYASLRGMTADGCATGAKDSGSCVLSLVTPRATLAARAFFQCAGLAGAELENQLTTACDLQGSHWEQRVLSGELMSSYQGHSNKLSALTLAAFEDSGWYLANYSAAEPWRRGDWGYAQGCAFATSLCLAPGSGAGLGSPPHFFAAAHQLSGGSANAALCTTDRLAVGYVPIVAPANGVQIPQQYRYFTTNVGGSPETFDYCPAVQAYSNRACFAASNNGYAGQVALGELMGANSSCFLSTLVKAASGYSAPGAACFPASCRAGPALVVTVGGVSVTCTSSGQQLVVPGFNGALTCPDLTLACSTPFDPPIVPNASEAIGLATPSASARPPSGPGGGSGGGGGGGGSSASATSALFGTAAGVGLGVIVFVAAACYFCLRTKPAGPAQLVAVPAPLALPPGAAIPYAHALAPQASHSPYGGNPRFDARPAFEPRGAVPSR
jgi:hypothetical protein